MSCSIAAYSVRLGHNALLALNIFLFLNNTNTHAMHELHKQPEFYPERPSMLTNLCFVGHCISIWLMLSCAAVAWHHPG